MTDKELRAIFAEACSSEPLAGGWPELEKFGKAVVERCAKICDDAAFQARIGKAACDEKGNPIYSHDALDCAIGALEQCAADMRSE